MTTTQTDRARRFEQLIADVHDPLERYLRRRAPRHDADDVMGDVLLTLWRRLDAVPDTSPLPWCYGVARRALANHRRGNRRRLQLVAKLGAQPPAHFDPDGAVDHPELAAALAAVSPDDRELIALWAWEGLEPREIAVVLDTTPNAVSLRLTRVKKKLARAINRQDVPPGGHRGSERTGSMEHD
jgi:RNA polymerase sigma-70 factor, ECF subfamily